MTYKVESHGMFSDWLTGTGPYVYEANRYHNTLIRV